MPRIKDDDIQALRERANIVDVVAGYTTLKRSGTNTFKGLCPFHSEKTPSFQVNAASALFHCFGCQEGGDIYRFIEKIENVPFADAVHWLAKREGYDLRYEEMRPGDKKAYGIKLRLVEANNLAAKFFHRALMSSPDALAARRYLEGRGFGKDVAERWQLGYAPGRDALCRYLFGAGFSAEEILQADLAKRSEKDATLYDTFRQRVVFPTWNLQGDVVGFGARALGDQQPKYLNTAETPVFAKSRIMYGLNRAKGTVARGAPAVVVEGYTDVIALHEAGIAEAVATNGVALGEGHFELLRKYTARAVLMFDADEAGRAATERAFGIHHRIGLEVLVAPLPPGRDPAEVAHEDAAKLREIIDGAQPLLEFKLEQTLSKLPLDTPEARAAAVRQAVQVLGWQPDPIARHEYAFLAARRIGVDPEVVQRALAEQARGASGQAAGAGDTARERRLPGHVKVEREALQLLLLQETEAIHSVEKLAESDFTSPARRELFRHALAAIQAGERPGPALLSVLSKDAQSLFAELAVGNLPDELTDDRVQEVFIRLRVFSLERDIKSRRNTLQDLNPLVDSELHDRLFTELVALEAQRRDLLRSLQGSA